ncbi:ATP-binding protein [soil metagenome]
MVVRGLWIERIESAWTKAPIAWLAGVRRTGKTTLAKQLGGAEYFNCDLPSTQDRLRDPETFFSEVRAKRIVLDEVHQLDDPSRVLKIAADEHPRLRVLATGSSTLSATHKFRDSLTGRKRVVRLTPVLYQELAAFEHTDLRARLLSGGLPPMLLAGTPEPEAYAEWLDSFWARDVQELFRIEKRGAFLKLCELLLRQSGGLFEVTSLARESGLSRPTVMTYLDVLEQTSFVTILRPHHGGATREILAQPKVYAFDTGFVCFARRWTTLHDEDCGVLWEHLVLDTLLAREGASAIHFWRDKSQREIDFVIPRGRDAVDAIECKWSAETFSPKSLIAFRAAYPTGRNFVVSPRRQPAVTRDHAGLAVTYVGLDRLVATLVTS